MWYAAWVGSTFDSRGFTHTPTSLATKYLHTFRLSRRVRLCAAHSIWAISLCSKRIMAHDSMGMIVWCVNSCSYVWLEFSIHQTFNVNGSRCSRATTNRFARIDKKETKTKQITSRIEIARQTISEYEKINKHFLLTWFPIVSECVMVSASIADDGEFPTYQWTNVRFCLPSVCCLLFHKKETNATTRNISLLFFLHFFACVCARSDA